MFYLIGQIFIILLIATLLGLGLGWWSRGLMRDLRDDSLAELGSADPFGARARLEQCHRDNANLRRELQESQQQLEQRLHVAQQTQDSDALSELQGANSMIKALLEDLQERDDTIAILERELEQHRTN